MEEIIIEPLESCIVQAGLAIQIPRGYFGYICSRSSRARDGLVVEGGVVDGSYHGEILIILYNNSKTQQKRIEIGDRVAQILILPVLNLPWVEVSKLSPTTRQAKGFGSTGVNNVQQSKEEKHAYKLGKQLTKEQEKQIRDLLEEFEDVIATSFEDIKGSKVKYQHEIDTGDHKPFRRAPYRIPPNHKKWVEDEINEMLKNGIIRESHSPWASPAILVHKKDGTLRMCMDYCELNKLTKKDAFPIPRITDILEYMEDDPEWFSIIDLFMGYNQFYMSKNAREKAAFVTHQGHYEYNRMPFGPTNAPATFQRGMNEVFGDMIGRGVYVYIDDISIYSKTFEEHLVLLREVLTRLRKFDLHLKPKKCTFAAPEVELLGHLINKDGVSPAPSKTEAIRNYPRPTSKKELRAFLGLVSYYRSFIKNCSKITEPISKMLKQTETFSWDEEKQKVFDYLKNVLTSETVLARPNFDHPFILHTDGSALGLGAVLSQRINKIERPIAYASRRTSATEEKYSASKIEMKAVVWATEKFKHYLMGRPFLLITDHTALKTLINLKDPPALFARWILSLQPYDIDVVYKPGRKHGNADALSRRPHRWDEPYFVERLPKRGKFLKKKRSVES